MLVEFNNEFLNFPIEDCSRLYKKDDQDGFKIVIENIAKNTMDGICLPSKEERDSLFEKLIKIASEKGFACADIQIKRTQIKGFQE